jgi:hypothetical protein
MQGIDWCDHDTKSTFLRAFSLALISAFCSIIFYCSATNAQTGAPPPFTCPLTSMPSSPSSFRDADRRSTEIFSGKKILFISARDKLTDTSSSGMSDLKNMLISMGFDITQEYPASITDTLLQEFNIVVFSNEWFTSDWVGAREISDEEAQVLIDFVNRGNGLLLLGERGVFSNTLNLNRSFNKIGASFGIQINHDILCDPTDHVNYSDDPDGGDVPYISQMSTHDVTSSVGKFILGLGSSLQITSPAKAIAFSDNDSWRDQNATYDTDIKHFVCIKDSNEQSGSYPDGLNRSAVA